jgi:hypothetical protein
MGGCFRTVEVGTRIAATCRLVCQVSNPSASRHRGRQFRMTRVVAACRISLAGVPGIFTLAGMGLQIPPGGLVVSIGDDGGPQMEVKDS